MNRKQTILLAILMNGALLVVLFLSALSSPEEIAIPPTHEVARPHAPMHEEPLLFVEDPPPTPQGIPAPISAVEPVGPILHALPPTSSPQSQIEAPPQAAAGTSLDAVTVTVKKGDSLEKIAKVHNTTVDEIIKINHLPSSFLKIGQVLKIPENSARKTAPAFKSGEKAASGPEYYVVKVGDNPWTIAMKHHLKVEELLKLNGLNEEKARKLKPGDRLRIK